MEALQYETVVIPPSFQEKMLEQARALHPQECCGVLGGRNNVVTSVYPVDNDLSSPDGYHANEKQLFNATRKMREKGEDMIGFYHSHPNGKSDPSEKDREQNHYPGHFYVIISFPENAAPILRCFVMSEDKEFNNVDIV